VRAVNGWILMTAGVGLLALHSYWRSAAPIIAIMVLIFGYVSARATGLWSGMQTVPVVEKTINEAKGRSILFRFENEDVIAGNVRKRPVFGWGRQAAPFDNRLGWQAVADSMWIGVFAQCGAVGLFSLIATLLVPVAVFVRNFPAREWRETCVAPAAALAVVLILYAIDDLANAMLNPVILLATGGLSGLGRRRLASPCKS
jgi:O-antigen ligase